MNKEKSHKQQQDLQEKFVQVVIVSNCFFIYRVSEKLKSSRDSFPIHRREFSADKRKRKNDEHQVSFRHQ